jgi:hypothetical protein
LLLTKGLLKSIFNQTLIGCVRGVSLACFL